MTAVITGLVGIITLFAVMLAGMPIGFAMLLVGATGTIYLAGAEGASHLVGQVSFDLISSYDYSVLPLFIFMASVCLVAGMAEKLFRFVNVWLGRLHGGVAMAAVGACAIFAAMSASSIATAVTIGSVAIPEMQQRKYDGGLAAAAVAAGGTLGILIPPSGIMIMYGIITQQSIGKLFAAGIIPGVILTLAYMAMIGFLAVRKPGIAPRMIEPVCWRERLKVVGGALDIMALIAVVIVGIIIGWFSPTEAGAIGVLGALLISVARRRLSWSSLKAAVADAMRNTGMLFIIIMGAYVFNSFLALTTIPMKLAGWVGGLGLPPMAVMIAIVAVYFVLGCFIDANSMVLLTIPIFFPLVTSVGFDPIWFGVIIVLMVELAAITPPLGLNVYVISGVAQDVPMQRIFRSVIPFVVVDFVVVGLLLAFPILATFIPAHM